MTHLRFLKRSKACVTEISNREFQLKNQIVIITTTVTIDTGNQCKYYCLAIMHGNTYLTIVLI